MITSIASTSHTTCWLLNLSDSLVPVLTPYSALRSFMDYNANQSPGRQLIVKDYSLCTLYTHDLFSAYMAYKAHWTRLSEMIKNMARYKARERTRDVPDPIQVNASSLNEARLLARQNMIIIAKETASLVLRPELADLDENGKVRPMPHQFPGSLAARMPVSSQPLIGQFADPIGGCRVAS